MTNLGIGVYDALNNFSTNIIDYALNTISMKGTTSKKTTLPELTGKVAFKLKY
jgi:hypothetical protein